jgi:hypothetical protein
MSNAGRGVEPDLPPGFFANESTDFLVKTRNRKSGAERYELQRELIRRVSDSGECGFLLALLNSKSLERKAFGSFLVGEIADKTGLVWPALRRTLTLWSGDLIHGFRYRFVDFITNSKYYDAEIAKGMSKCLSDDSNFVRQSAIYWLCSIKPIEYINFYEYCFGENRKKEIINQNPNARLSRAFSISNLLRIKKSAKFVLNEIKFEEFETFVFLSKIESRLLRNMSHWDPNNEEYDLILNENLPTI